MYLVLRNLQRTPVKVKEDGQCKTDYAPRDQVHIDYPSPPQQESPTEPHFSTVSLHTYHKAMGAQEQNTKQDIHIELPAGTQKPIHQTVLR
jgi:hypothetical protein